MPNTDLLITLQEKLARRRFLNQHEGRRRLCVAPPPQSISLTFREADALEAELSALRARQQALEQGIGEALRHDYPWNIRRILETLLSPRPSVKE